MVGTFRHEAADFTKLKALQVAAKGALNPFLVHITDLAEHLYVWWPDAFDPARVDVDARDIAVDWVELGRGMPL